MAPADAGRESGVIDVKWRPDAGADPLVAGLPTLSRHADAVSRPPPCAVWLGESKMYPYPARPTAVAGEG